MSSASQTFSELIPVASLKIIFGCLTTWTLVPQISLQKIAPSIAIAAVLFLSASPIHAQVDQILGEITSTPVAFSGTTIGASNDIHTYPPSAHFNAFWDQDYIYQFSVSSAGTLYLVSDDPNDDPDNDFFVLSSLETSLNVNEFIQANDALTATDGFVVWKDGSWFLPSAGTYYLSVDAWRGSLTGEMPAIGYGGPFSGTLTFEAIPEPGVGAMVLLGLAAAAAMRRTRKDASELK